MNIQKLPDIEAHVIDLIEWKEQVDEQLAILRDEHGLVWNGRTWVKDDGEHTHQAIELKDKNGRN